MRSLNLKHLEFRSAERIMFNVSLFALFIDLFLVFWKSSNIDWLAYGGVTAFTVVLLAIGSVYRLLNRSERIAAALVGTAGLMFFSMVMSLFNYLLLPIVRAPIDHQLAAIDAMFGFYWPHAMQIAAHYPMITTILKVAYLSTLPQLAVLIVVLGLSGRHRDMHVLLLAVVVTATLAICFWGLFPSLGAKSLYQLPPAIWAAVAPVVDQSYAEALKRMAIDGPGLISPNEIRGLIAFPSYHASLAFIALYSSRNLKYVFPIFLVLNVLIIPATFVHGGHHLIDPFAGMILFALGVLCAKRFVDAEYKKTGAVEIIPV